MQNIFLSISLSDYNRARQLIKKSYLPKFFNSNTIIIGSKNINNNLLNTHMPNTLHISFNLTFMIIL